MKMNYPPYTITDKMLNLATNIMNLFLYIHFQMGMEERRDYGKQQYLHIGKSWFYQKWNLES